LKDSADVASPKVSHTEAENIGYAQQLKTTPNPVCEKVAEKATSAPSMDYPMIM